MRIKLQNYQGGSIYVVDLPSGKHYEVELSGKTGKGSTVAEAIEDVSKLLSPPRPSKKRKNPKSTSLKRTVEVQVDPEDS